MAFVMNTVKAPVALAQLAANSVKARGVRIMMENHYRENSPVDLWREDYHHVKFTYSCGDLERHRYLAHDLPISRKDFTEYAINCRDCDLMHGPMQWSLIFGGLPAVFGLPIWASEPHRLPSTFFGSEDALREQGLMRDQECHIKWAPHCNHGHARILEYFISGEPKYNDAFDSISNGFIQKRDPKAIRKMAQYVGRVQKLSFMPGNQIATSQWIRHHCHYWANMFLNKPHFLLDGPTLTHSINDHYLILYQEDQLVQKEGVHTLNDFEFYDLCNRRQIARWEENLSRNRLEDRYEKWCELTRIEPGVQTDYVPIRVVLCYQTSHFRDPGFLDENLATLDEPDWNSAWDHEARDIFERRLMFENGPLAAQVAKHVEGLQAAEKALAAEEAKRLEA